MNWILIIQTVIIFILFRIVNLTILLYYYKKYPKEIFTFLDEKSGFFGFYRILVDNKYIRIEFENMVPPFLVGKGAFAIPYFIGVGLITIGETIFTRSFDSLIFYCIAALIDIMLSYPIPKLNKKYKISRTVNYQEYETKFDVKLDRKN